ncbi:hypothetical protein LTR56_000708 [Elasticomyces elasticus]|nr:hypothetical protein LTR56_000708 [Elasticomyces elasticus]KAK4929275.1 hypothetical protein LTR49_004172 [Elasticomyces elasticus]KAK5765831.1 hypothetical protein LTS12_004091 [Elasticomyces elasticus]
MIDPLSSLAIACAVAQFVDFSATLFERAYKISKSSDAGLPEVTELEELVNRLRRLGEKIEKSRTDGVDPNQHVDISDDDAQAIALAYSCEQLAKRIAITFQDFKIQNQPNIWDSLKLAYAIGRKKKDIAALKIECAKLKDDLMDHMATSIYDQQSRLTRTLDDINRQGGLMEVNLTGKLDAIRADLVQALPRPNTGSRAVKQRVLTVTDKQLANLLTQLLNESKSVSASQKLLESLRYEYMEARRSAVAERHASTFEWVFESSDDQSRAGKPRMEFSDWLKRHNGLFWVSGKAGSGKSTLMKYLSAHRRTVEMLKQWGGGARVIIATHFFWNAGSTLQKSHIGLLRTLCYEVLLQCPNLIPLVCKERLAGFTYVERLRTQKLESEGRAVRFCFFIDGLDEYGGDHADIIAVLRQLALSEHIKICASSRPWNVFQNAFGHDAHRMLVLQDLTHDDIVLYVREKLESDERFIELQQEDPRCESLIEDVTEKANGVFLWVALVVRQLLKSLDNADGVHDLTRRLQELPPGLEEYFQHMFENIDEFYNQQTARMFQICVWSEWPLALVAYAVLDAEDPVAASIISSKHVDMRDIEKTEKRLHKRVNGRCQDLLEVSASAQGGYPVVDFLHRTVRDFLMTRDMHELLVARAGADFNAMATLCKMSLVEVRRIRNTSASDLSRPQAQAVHHMVWYARRMEIEQQATPFEDLLHLEQLLSALPSKREDSYLQELIPYRKASGPFIPLAINGGLILYLQQRDSAVLKASYRPSLLRLALEDFSRNPDDVKVVVPELVNLLLQNGANANERGLGRRDKEQHQSTPWLSFLGNMGTSTRNCSGETRSSLLLTTEFLLQGGASYEGKVIIRRHGYHETLTENEVLSSVFGSLEASRLQRLRPSPYYGVKMVRGFAGSVHDTMESMIKLMIGAR